MCNIIIDGGCKKQRFLTEKIKFPLLYVSWNSLRNENIIYKNFAHLKIIVSL